MANHILTKGVAEGLPIDPMKLLKLTYVAHGWVLGITDQPLVSQEVCAWPYGPVIADVYDAFKRFRYLPIDSFAMKFGISGSVPYPTQLPDTVEPIVGRVWELYKSYTGLQLSTITHREGSPWEQVTRGKKPEEIRDIPIPTEIIRNYYKGIALRRGAKNG